MAQASGDQDAIVVGGNGEDRSTNWGSEGKKKGGLCCGGGCCVDDEWIAPRWDETRNGGRGVVVGLCPPKTGRLMARAGGKRLAGWLQYLEDQQHQQHQIGGSHCKRKAAKAQARIQQVKEGMEMSLDQAHSIVKG